MATFKDAPTSYKDPFWQDLASSTEEKLGLPKGVLQSILLYGERSNADQVSSAGAKTPFQIIPQTRQGIIKNYGIDPYLSPETAAEGAGLLLKESLQRNGGDVNLAIREYHGGLDRKQWGPVNRSYVQRVLKGIEELIPAAQAGELPQETFESRVLNAYREGKMTQEQQDAFLQDVQSGAFTLPAGESAERLVTERSGQVEIQYPIGEGVAQQPQASDLPKPIWDAYTSGQMNDEQRSALEADVQAGLVRVPESISMQQPSDMSLTLPGTTGAITRGLAPVAGGAALGAMAGAPFAGVGAVPGAIAGATAGGLAYALGDPIVSGINSLLGTQYQMPTEALSDLLTRIGVPMAQTEAEKIVQTVSGATGAGAAGATAGRALQTAATSPMAREIGRQFAAQPGAQITAATTGELAGEVARREGAGAPAEMAAQLLGGLGGGVAASRIGGARIIPGGLSPQQAEAAQAAERLGIRTLTSDVMPPQTFVGRTAQATGERIPFAGTGGVRQAQAEERIDAVKDVIRYYGGESAEAVTKAPESVMLDVATQRARQLSQYSTAKNEVIDRLSNQGDVPVNRTIAQIDAEIAKLQSLRSEAFDPVIAVLNDWKTALQGQNLRNVEELRKVVGKAFSDPSLAAVRDIGEKALSRIYAPLRQDMSDFIKTVGQRRDITKWEVANRRLADLAGDLESTTLKNVLRRGDATPEVINSMLFSQKPSDLRTLYKSLSPEGRANARMAIIARAAEKAGGFDEISPERFLNELKRLGQPVNIFFRGEDLDRVQGLVKALKLTQRASVAAAAPPTGVQAVPFVAGSLLTDLLGGSAAAATATAGALGLAARTYESQAMKTVLTLLPKVKSGSKEEAALVKRFLSIVESQGREFESESE